MNTVPCIETNDNANVSGQTDKPNAELAGSPSRLKTALFDNLGELKHRFKLKLRVVNIQSNLP